MSFKNFLKEYKFNVGSIYNSDNVEVVVKFRENYKNSSSRTNYLFVTGEPNQREIKKTGYINNYINVAPGGTNLNTKVYEEIKQIKKDESYDINLFLENFDWYLVTNKNNSDCNNVIKILEEAGYNQRKFDLYAGCKICPCSPGFKLSSKSKHIKNTAIFINFKSL